ncbi:hypothetical protein ACFY5F_29120 [Streptomyces sp. NPDC013161]|uniref:hypothetical protein n=1 Tax=Streptomyces sp. NPDC013161 TaxID=3364862 RepID=UPI00368BD3FA
MARVVGVHGVDEQLLSEESLLREGRPALPDGLRRFHEIHCRLPAHLPGLQPERKLHAGVILHWRHLPSRLAIDWAPVPLWLRLGLSTLAVGTFASATRDAYAVIGFPRPPARWPWQAPGVGARQPGPAWSGAAE